MNSIPTISYNEDEEVYLLKDIALELWQINKMKKMANGMNFSAAGKNINKSINQMLKNKERLVDEYNKTYGKEPDIEYAKRIFLRDKEKDDKPR